MSTRFTWMFLLLSYFSVTNGQDVSFEPQEPAYVIKGQSLTFTYTITTGVDKWRVTSFYVNELSNPVIRLAPGSPDLCRLASDEPPSIYSYTCNASTGVMTFTIDPVSQSFDGNIVRCSSSFGVTVDDFIIKESRIIITDVPDKAPVITQTPQGIIIEGHKLILTCSVSGGYPLAVLSWNCSGNYNNNTSGNTSSYRVDFIVDKTYNNRICTCSGSHVMPSYRPILHHKLVVYYAPDNNPSIQQSPSGNLFDGDVVKLTCSVSGGNPLAILSWNCTGSNTNNTSGDTASYDVEFTADKSYNDKTCTCTATHPVTLYKPVVHTFLEVFYVPDKAPVIAQTPQGQNISGDKVTLTCSVSGGHPLAVLTWNCSGNNINKTSGNTASYSVDFIVDKTYNNRICTCFGSHIVPSYRPILHHRLLVYYAPDNNPNIQQSPSGSIFDGDVVKLTCSISGGNPLATLSWNCTGSNTNNTSRDTASYTVKFTVDKSYNDKTCTCTATHPVTLYRPVVHTLLEVFYAPHTTPVIRQSPTGAIISGDKLTLTCAVSGGNPLAVLSWNCSGIYNDNTSGNTASYSVDFIVDKTYNNRICTCSGRHIVPSYRPTVHHRLLVYYAPGTTPTIQQTPDGPIVPGNKVILTCTAPGGNPLAVLSWDCNGTVTNHTSENTASYSVEFTTDTTYNNRICNCSATHLVTSYRPSVQHKLEVYCSPLDIQIQDEHGLFTAGISSLVISVLALILTIVIACWRFRMTKASKSPDHYTEFNTKGSTETVAYDVINQTTNIDTNTVAIEDTDMGVNTYEECQPNSTTDHSSDDVKQDPKGSKMMTGEEYDYVN